MSMFIVMLEEEDVEAIVAAQMGSVIAKSQMNGGGRYLWVDEEGYA